jgi:hypothetical protein
MDGVGLHGLGVRSDDRTVGYSDVSRQAENVGQTDKSEISAFGIVPGAESDAQHSQGAPALSDRETAPEVQKGQFVGIINELTRAWRLRRSIATVQDIIDRDAKIVRDSD